MVKGKRQNFITFYAGLTNGPLKCQETSQLDEQSQLVCPVQICPKETAKVKCNNIYGSVAGQPDTSYPDTGPAPRGQGGPGGGEQPASGPPHCSQDIYDSLN